MELLMNEESKKEVLAQPIKTNTAIGGRVKEVDIKLQSKIKTKNLEITETLTEALNK